MNWFWQVIGPVKQRAIGAYVEKMLLRKSAEADLACYENPEFYDKYVRAMDEAYDRIMKVMYTLYDLIARVIALTANSFLLFTIDPWLILFGLFPLVLGIFRRLENVANHDMEIKKKTVNRRMEYVRRTFYPVSYTHLDVYKRQLWKKKLFGFARHIRILRNPVLNGLNCLI